ncbi:MAG TPA: EscU/YscU/HrcU family type III secretion system export apparatus switch protein, partial [Kofleriaceae bacterium]|nr:EscU/YscU/HrcU family type III secretion system export apparatus switch protein [Kofleriaceae bacterium]
LDALLRHAALGTALAMTAEEKRQDERLSAADPRWRARRLEVARAARPSGAGGSMSRAPDDARVAIAASNLLLVGDDVAVAIAYDPVRRPTPTRIAAGVGAAATQLLAHARRQALPIHRDAQLAAVLAGDVRAGDSRVPHRGESLVARERAIDEAHWVPLAEIVAAVRGR